MGRVVIVSYAVRHIASVLALAPLVKYVSNHQGTTLASFFTVGEKEVRCL